MASESAVAETSAAHPRPRPAFRHEFRPEQLRTATWSGRLIRSFLAHPEWLLRPLRAVLPAPRIGRWVIVLRYDGVRDVLSRDDVFVVPFGPRITEVDRAGRNFILGMDDTESSGYRPGLARVMRVMRLEDLDHVGHLARAFAADVLSAPRPEIDIVADLFTPATIHVVERYFGIPVSEAGEDPHDARHAFALWAMALSNYIFATHGKDETARRAALAAGEALGRTVDTAIARAKVRLGNNAAAAGDGATLVDRFVRDCLRESGTVSEDDVQNTVRPALDGLITAFVPNCTVAATNILLVLLERPDVMDRCRAAARTGDDSVLGRHLLEAFRFRPLFPGPVRICTRDYMLATDGGRPRRIAKNSTVLACTQSAMFDARAVSRPELFDPERPASHSMQFGFGLHSCVGTALATTQLVNTFRPLLRGPPVRRVPGVRGRVGYFGAFPEHMLVTFGQ
jgi:cytochrome P450